MVKNISFGFLFVLLLIGTGGGTCGTALAGMKAKAPAAAPTNNPCQSDINKYCNNVVPGNGRLAKCMKKHASELSYGCKHWGEQYAKKHPSVTKGINGK